MLRESEAQSSWLMPLIPLPILICVQAYDWASAPQWSCDATQDACNLAIIFVARVPVTSATLDAAEHDALGFGGSNVGLISPHVYDADLAKGMVASGVNRFHGGDVVAMVPVARLDAPGNLRNLQRSLCEVRGSPLCVLESGAVVTHDSRLTSRISVCV